MNARTQPFGHLLAASYDHHGLTLDLYGTLTEDGYTVEHVLIPGTLMAITECVSADLLDVMGAYCDDTLPSAEELRKAHGDAAAAERAAHDRSMGRAERASSWGSMPNAARK